VLIGNADMHLKNWSLLYPDGRTPALAPAYDLVSTIAFLPDERMALSLEKSKRMREVSLDRLLRMAGRAGIPTHRVEETVTGTVERFLDQWRGGDWRDGLPASAARRLDEHLATLPLVMRGG